jgi:hypothetical protein
VSNELPFDSMAKERKTVTLFLYLPEEKKVVLSRRGKLEKKPGLIQATVHGQIEPGEISHIAMKREFAEELKGDFHRLTGIIDLGENTVGDTTIEHTYYHAAVMPKEMLGTLQTTQEVQEILTISESEIGTITPYSKVDDKLDSDFSDQMVMFDDELEVLKKVFKAFG